MEMDVGLGHIAKKATWYAVNMLVVVFWRCRAHVRGRHVRVNGFGRREVKEEFTPANAFRTR